MHPILGHRRRISLYLVAWIPLGALLAGLLVVAGDSGWRQAGGIAVPLVAVYAFLCLGAWYSCRALPLGRAGLLPAVAAHVATAACSAALWVILAWGLARLLDRMSLGSATEDLVVGQAPLLFAVGVVLYLLSVTVHYLVVEFEAARDAERRALRAQVETREAQLRALRAQLHPHFLFNSLNSINSMIGGQPEEARRMCIQLGDFLRDSLRSAGQPAIPLGEELKLVRRYLAIEQVRYGARLSLDEAIDPDLEPCVVPPLILQPIVENALKHGISGLVDGGTVRIEARREGRRLRIVVANPKDPESATSRGAGLGLVNVRERLRAAYGNEARLVCKEQGDGFRAEVVIPVVWTEVSRAEGDDA